jgi:hypothetical protein
MRVVPMKDNKCPSCKAYFDDGEGATSGEAVEATGRQSEALSSARSKPHAFAPHRKSPAAPLIAVFVCTAMYLWLLSGLQRLPRFAELAIFTGLLYRAMQEFRQRKAAIAQESVTNKPST